MNKAQPKPLGPLSMENMGRAADMLLCKVRSPSLHVLFARLPGLDWSAGRREGPDQSPACHVTDSPWDRMGWVCGSTLSGGWKRPPGCQARKPWTLFCTPCGYGRGWPWAQPCPRLGTGGRAASPWQQHREPHFPQVLLCSCWEVPARALQVGRDSSS